MKFLKQATSIRCLIANLSKFVQTACWPPQNLSYRGCFENKKGPGTSFQARIFVDFFGKKNIS